MKRTLTHGRHSRYDAGVASQRGWMENLVASGGSLESIMSNKTALIMNW